MSVHTSHSSNLKTMTPIGYYGFISNYLEQTILNVTVFGVTDSTCLAQFNIVSPAINVNLRLLAIPCKEFWALQIYNTTVIVTYYMNFHNFNP